VSGFPPILPKCYKTHTCTLGQKERDREREREKGREGGKRGVHCCRPNVIKCTRALAGRERGRERGEGGRELGVHRHKLM